MPNTPDSCCAPGITSGTCSPVLTPASIYRNGCGTILNDFINSSGNIIGAVALGVAGIQVCIDILSNVSI